MSYSLARSVALLGWPASGDCDASLWQDWASQVVFCHYWNDHPCGSFSGVRSIGLFKPLAAMRAFACFSHLDIVDALCMSEAQLMLLAAHNITSLCIPDTRATAIDQIAIVILNSGPASRIGVACSLMCPYGRKQRIGNICIRRPFELLSRSATKKCSISSSTDDKTVQIPLKWGSVYLETRFQPRHDTFHAEE